MVGMAVKGLMNYQSQVGGYGHQRTKIFRLGNEVGSGVLAITLSHLLHKGSDELHRDMLKYNRKKSILHASHRKAPEMIK
jgi:hypothetical protein